MIGLRIQQAHGHYLQLVMDAGEAFRVINDFAAKKLPDRIGSHNVRCLPPSPQWACDTASVLGMHTCVIEQAGQMPAQGGYQTQFGRSGL